MANLLERLKSNLADGIVDLSLQPEVVNEVCELRTRIDKLEEVLIMIVRTGWPWDEEGKPNAIHATCKDGFSAAMVEARELLGLDHLSAINRTEPRT